MKPLNDTDNHIQRLHSISKRKQREREMRRCQPISIRVIKELLIDLLTQRLLRMILFELNKRIDLKNSFINNIIIHLFKLLNC